jgi:putative ABC transport system ATP-binding protein
MSPIIWIDSLNHSFGEKDLKKQVLSKINLQLFPSEITIMTGPSGSGKTTLLSLIGGLRSVQEGRLTAFGQKLNGANEHQLVRIRRQIGYIFQAHNLLPFLTARQNVQMSIELHENIPPREAIAKSEAILREVGLGHRIDYYPEHLSGGQKQRVAIARALVSHPKLVLADEPTAALDSQTGRDVVNLLYRLAKEQGCTILLVTHDHRVFDIADRLIHMEDGHLLSDVTSPRTRSPLD